MPILAIIAIGSALVGGATAVVVGNTWGALDDTIEGTGNVVKETTNLATVALAAGALYLGGKYMGLIK